MTKDEYEMISATINLVYNHLIQNQYIGIIAISTIWNARGATYIKHVHVNVQS